MYISKKEEGKRRRGRRGGGGRGEKKSGTRVEWVGGKKKGNSVVVRSE